jgi:hypothetical protein
MKPTETDDLIEDVELADLLDEAKIAEAAALEEAKKLEEAKCKKEEEDEDSKEDDVEDSKEDDEEDDEEEMDEAKADPAELKKQLDKYKANLKFAKDAKAKATIQNFIDQIQGKLDALEEAFGKKDDDSDDDADGKDDDNDGKADDDDNEPDDDDSKGEDKDKPKPAFLKKMKKEAVDFTTDLGAIIAEDESLSEEFKEKAGTLFEVALNTRVREEKDRLQEEFDNRINEETAKIRETLEEKVDNYLTYAVESWVEDNKIAIESGLRTEVAESFIEALKGVFVEHYIEVPEAKKDIVAELETKLVVAEEALCASGKQATELSEQVEKLVREKILAEAAESLADTQGARLQALAEDVEFVDEETFRKKVATIKECYFQRKGQVIEEAAPSNSFETTEVIVEDSDESVNLSPTMQNYVKALARVNKASSFTSPR